MKKVYEKPILDVTACNIENVIALSGTFQGAGFIQENDKTVAWEDLFK